MTRRRCFLIGHHDAPDGLSPLLTAAIEQHITVFGVTEFIVGHYGGFDRLAAKALAAAKEKHPGIVLLVSTPYHPAECIVSIPDDLTTFCSHPAWKTRRAGTRFCVSTGT